MGLTRSRHCRRSNVKSSSMTRNDNPGVINGHFLRNFHPQQNQKPCTKSVDLDNTAIDEYLHVRDGSNGSHT